MTSKLLTSKLFKPTPAKQIKDESPFSGIWIRWSVLNAAERLVCANIVLLPAWWAAGLLGYMPEFMLAGIMVYDWYRYGKLRLKHPSLVVVALFAFYAYSYIDTFLLFFNAYPSIDLPPDFVVKSTDLVKSAFSFSLPCLIWYIQSRDARVRLEVIAWACSVSIVQMLGFWLVIHLFFPELILNPPRSLYGVLTGKSKEYSYTNGAANYLIFYEEGRFRFFFGHYQACAAFLGFTSMVALDLKNRFWSLLLLMACVFLMTLVASRSVWLAFPAALLIYFLLATRKVGGVWLLSALIAIVSFVTLSLPPVTNLIFDTSTGTATAVGNYRSGSTESRAEVYKETLAKIPDRLIFGHKVEGPPVYTTVGELVGPPVGSHSFILGDLLYKKGLIGTGLFATFWVSLVFWLYNTRAGRPICWFPILLLFSLLLSITELQLTIAMCILICMMLHRPKMKFLKRSVA